MWKREEIAPKEQFLLFSTLFYIYILTSGVKLHIHLLNVVVQFIVFFTLSTLICRSTDISKCFSESLGIRDNKSRPGGGMNTWKRPLLPSGKLSRPGRLVKALGHHTMQPNEIPVMQCTMLVKSRQEVL